MKILSAVQMKEADLATMRQQSITSLELMERASRKMHEQLLQDFQESSKYVLLCGDGNNGGDGLALARMLHMSGNKILVYLVQSDRYSEDNNANQQRLINLHIPIRYFGLSDDIEIPTDSIVIDALFGYGLNRPLSYEWNNIISQINDSTHTIISIDLPSGLLADLSSPAHAPIVQADNTYTFQSPKLALLLPQNAIYSKAFKILDIGLDTEFIQKTTCPYYYVQHRDIVPILPQHTRFAHKGTFGHTLIIGGSYGKIGAVILSSQAALRSGCGLVTSFIPKCGYIPLQASLPESMVLTDQNEHMITGFPEDISPYKSIAIGIGMGMQHLSQQALFDFLKQINTTHTASHLVLDADALNILALQKAWISLLPSFSILTPHPKELERLIGTWDNDFDKLSKAKTFAHLYQVILVIKGANTTIVCPEGEIFFNSSGNWGMATGGSGDVLTGILAALLAQGLEPKDAALAGVYLHGLAGDQATKTIHPKSLIASDIIQHITDAWYTATSPSNHKN